MANTGPIQLSKATTRVTPVVFGSTTCSSSPNKPIIVTSPTRCPCFLRYIIVCDQPTTWDIFFLPEASYQSWASLEFAGDPVSHIAEFSTLQERTFDVKSVLYTPDTNVKLNGTFRLFVRTNTIERRCFSDIQSTSTPTSIVLQPTPSPCPLLSLKTSRIVGGTIVNSSHLSSADSQPEFTWMAHITHRTSQRHVCGGSLISIVGYVITAAHCDVQLFPSEYDVTIGSGDPAIRSTKKTTFRIRRVFTHPLYSPQSAKNVSFDSDIAVLELSSFNFNSKLFSVLDLNRNASLPPAGAILTAAGYGSISFDWSTNGESLRRVDIPQVANDECTFSNTDLRMNSSVHLCAGGVSGCDVCDGDDGSPLHYVADDGLPLLVGIASFNMRCGESPLEAGVYARMSSFAPWVDKVILVALNSGGGSFWKRKWAVGLVFGTLAMVAFCCVATAVVIPWRKWIFGGAKGSAQSSGSDDEGELMHSGSDIPSETGISE